MQFGRVLFRSVSSDAVLRVKDITTQAATANTVDIRTTTGKALSFESTGTYTGVAGDGTAANGDAVNIVTTGAGGTVTFDKALAAGSITVDEIGRGAGRGRGEISGGAGSLKKKKKEQRPVRYCENKRNKRNEIVSHKCLINN